MKKKRVKNKSSFLKIGLVGNPNVGKSTVFNGLTGLKQHTGNWPGKTVSNASGAYTYHDREYLLYDLPGTYSLIAHSKEEECARDFVCFEEQDGMIIVCDAVCLERNLNLVLQTLEITKKAVVVVNLMDEAKKKGIEINLTKLSHILGVPVVGASARSGQGLTEIMDEVEKMSTKSPRGMDITYSAAIEKAIMPIEEVLKNRLSPNYNCRWLALQLLHSDECMQNSIKKYIAQDFFDDPILKDTLQTAKTNLLEDDITTQDLSNKIVSTLVKKAESIASQVVTYKNQNYQAKDRKIDSYITSKKTGIPLMILLLMFIFWLTISLSNYPSEMLFSFFHFLEPHVQNFFVNIGISSGFLSLLMDGVYRVLTWVISVMLPPMMIFFPLFTLLEDLGYLPRIAFNLDHCFRKCHACGKQALTMCMGFGCNAVGVVGCRIIDSPRERLIAILTNCFVPCNGRFPTIIAILTMFFVGFRSDLASSFTTVILLTGTILIGIFLTMLISYILSKTLLKGIPSSFTLELPPYRKPQVLRVITSSLLDRTLHILGRAVLASIPAGILIWVLAHVEVGGLPLLQHGTNFLNPFAELIGMDGAILMGFILGFPANEIVIPIILMIYLSNGSLVDFDNLLALREILISNGWTWLTAVSMILFSLMHFPCATTCLTIHKETGSWKWTFLSIVIPLVAGVVICFLLTSVVRLLGLV